MEALRQDLIAYDQTAIKTGVTLTRKLNSLWTVSAGVAATEEHINQIVSVTQTVRPLRTAKRPSPIRPIG